MRRIACLDLDAFFVEVALQAHPELRGKPVAVGGNASGRGVICSASYEARPFRIKAGMPSWQAQQRCPQLHILPVPPIVGEVSDLVGERLRRWCPLVDTASIDEFFLDFTGCDRVYPVNLTLAENICRDVYETLQLPATIGFGTNRLIAKVASDLAKPRGILEIIPGAEGAFLAPLPLKRIPGIGPKTEELLQSLGLTRVGDISQVAPETWQVVLGRHGDSLYRHSLGLCETPVIADQQKMHQKRLSREKTLGESSISVERLHGILSRLTERAVYDLRRAGLTCGGVTVRLRYDDFVTVSRSRRLIRTNMDQDVFAVAATLLRDLFTRRLKVRLVGVALDHLMSGGMTADFWSLWSSEDRRRFPEVVDEIRSRFGFKAILRARSLDRPPVRAAAG
jgi:DNA polymerase-4